MNSWDIPLNTIAFRYCSKFCFQGIQRVIRYWRHVVLFTWLINLISVLAAKVKLWLLKLIIKSSHNINYIIPLYRWKNAGKLVLLSGFACIKDFAVTVAKYDRIHHDGCAGNKLIFTYLLSETFWRRKLKNGTITLN